MSENLISEYFSGLEPLLIISSGSKPLYMDQHISTLVVDTPDPNHMIAEWLDDVIDPTQVPGPLIFEGGGGDTPKFKVVRMKWNEILHEQRCIYRLQRYIYRLQRYIYRLQKWRSRVIMRGWSWHHRNFRNVRIWLKIGTETNFGM